MRQLDLFADDTTAGVTHICLPDFSLACGVGYLEKPANDRVLFGWSKPPTCPWCRSLGRAYCQHVASEMQRRAA